jgi:hypothetical protein
MMIVYKREIRKSAYRFYCAARKYISLLLCTMVLCNGYKVAETHIAAASWKIYSRKTQQLVELPLPL